MADSFTWDEVVKMRESCLEKAKFYATMAHVANVWLLLHEKLGIGTVTQNQDPGAGS